MPSSTHLHGLPGHHVGVDVILAHKVPRRAVAGEDEVVRISAERIRAYQPVCAAPGNASSVARWQTWGSNRAAFERVLWGTQPSSPDGTVPAAARAAVFTIGLGTARFPEAC